MIDADYFNHALKEAKFSTQKIDDPDAYRALEWIIVLIEELNRRQKEVHK